MALSLSKLPWYGQVALFVSLAGGIVGAFYYYYEQPARAEMETRQAQLDQLQGEIRKGLETAKQLPRFRAEVAALEARLQNLKAILPEEKDAADLLRRLQIVATQSSLVIKSFKPAATVTKELHAEWPISLELDGTYHNLALFFDRVAKFTRIINIGGLGIKTRSNQNASTTITATCTATTFVLLDKAPKKPAAPAAPPPAPASPAGAKGA